MFAWHKEYNRETANFQGHTATVDCTPYPEEVHGFCYRLQINGRTFNNSNDPEALKKDAETILKKVTDWSTGEVNFRGWRVCVSLREGDWCFSLFNLFSDPVPVWEGVYPSLSHARQAAERCLLQRS
jgi:hypothetical protein